MNQTGKKKDCCDTSYLIYDGSVQSIIKITETPVGPKFENVCAKCSTRCHGDSCHRYSWCLANCNKPGAPYTLPWTKFDAEIRHWDTDPCSDFDKQTHYLKMKFQ